jgi:predicted dehydrogenase
MVPSLTRRDFLRLGAAGSAAASLNLACSLPPSGGDRLKDGMRLRHAGIGVGGMGASDLGQIASHPDVDIVALCDVDADNLAKAAAKYPNARTFSDWRTMFEEMGAEIDSVHVTTPDHNHAVPAAWALAAGMHVYCQKPLSHDVWEARMLERLAARHGGVTQMGIQNHSGANYRTAKAFFDLDPVGPVSSVHVWTDRPAGWWPQDVERPEGEDPVPEKLAWDLWLGTAPDRPYVDGAYHAFVWRGRKDFGTGAQGDMACHLMDPALWFLGLDRPTRVKSMGPKPKADSFPLWSEIHYRFKPTARTIDDEVSVVWYDGKKLPESAFASFGVEEPYANASFFVGEERALLVSPYEPCRLFARGQGEIEFELDGIEGRNHWHEFVDACYGRGETTTPFAYSGPLTEVALLGNVAMEFPGEILEWDGRDMSFRDRPDADQWLKREYREGWGMPS